jgi:hypothetical protein
MKEKPESTPVAETLHALHGTTEAPVKNGSRGERGTGTTLSIDFKEHPALLEKIRKAAKDEDREPSKYLRRRILQLDTEGKLF